MQLDVPCIAHRPYVEFLRGIENRLAAVHFRVPLPAALDSRNLPRREELAELNDLLSLLSVPRKHALLNSRFYSPRLYTTPEALAPILLTLRTLLAQGNLHGIIFSDHYLLQALGRADPELCSQMEAIPSVNAMLDSFDKISAHLELITVTPFRPPTQLVLDRALNRDLGRLGEVSSRCRAAFPSLRLALLANEGCLAQCPFKPAHDAHIALANLGDEAANPLLNSDLGCIDHLARHPARLFKSPFIRPEDQQRYAPYVDQIKLCGRTLGAEFLTRTVRAYADGTYSGNLLDLFDTMEWLAKRLSVANRLVPPEFFAMVTACAKECRACGYCDRLHAEIARPLPFALPDLRP
ncbi:MAG TPA: hypothetical protein VLL73_08765 [Desulfurivibrionaceae bacterium]|nr:hypothetical protein [Desulfurivibrionaceae bacterium]